MIASQIQASKTDDTILINNKLNKKLKIIIWKQLQKSMLEQ
jgi:hypothetical protein